MSEERRKSYRIVEHEPAFVVVAEADSVTEALAKCPDVLDNKERWLERWSESQGQYVAL